jgi:hypothetical protein
MMKTNSESTEDLVPLDTLRLSTRCALTAICYQQNDEAQKIVDGLRPLFGHYIAVAMADATVATATQRYADALSILERLARTNPQVDSVVCACAMLKRDMGIAGWREMAQHVVDYGRDADAVTLAAQALGRSAAPSDPGKFSTARQAGLRFA